MRLHIQVNMTSKAINLLSQVASRFRPSVSVDIGKRVDLFNFRPRQSKNPILPLCATAQPTFTRMDVHESKDANTVTATFELPGMKSNDVNIDIHQNGLTVAGEAKQPHWAHEEGYTVRERSYGKFSRTLQVPLGIKVSVRRSPDAARLSDAHPLVARRCEGQDGEWCFDGDVPKNDLQTTTASTTHCHSVNVTSGCFFPWLDSTFCRM